MLDYDSTNQRAAFTLYTENENSKIVYFMDEEPTYLLHPFSTIHTQLDVISLALNHAGPTSQRLLALLDKNHDLYLTPARGGGAKRTISLGKRQYDKVDF